MAGGWFADSKSGASGWGKMWWVVGRRKEVSSGFLAQVTWFSGDELHKLSNSQLSCKSSQEESVSLSINLHMHG
jgi:hypothetical protein